MCGDPRALEERMVATVTLHNACDALCASGLPQVFGVAFGKGTSEPMPADFEELLKKLDMPRRS